MQGPIYKVRGYMAGFTTYAPFRSLRVAVILAVLEYDGFNLLPRLGGGRWKFTGFYLVVPNGSYPLGGGTDVGLAPNIKYDNCNYLLRDWGRDH